MSNKTILNHHADCQAIGLIDAKKKVVPQWLNNITNPPKITQQLFSYITMRFILFLNMHHPSLQLSRIKEHSNRYSQGIFQAMKFNIPI